MKLTILNDVHLGVTRSAGTTPQSAHALREYIADAFSHWIGIHADAPLLILGDLFDDFSVDVQTILNTYLTLSNWLQVSKQKLHLVPGNHDWSAKAGRLSGFHFLSSLLEASYPGQVVVYAPELATVCEGVYVIPHCSNQDLFNAELEKAKHLDGGTLLLHCNFDNKFAVEADHSLNLNLDWAETLTEKHHLVFAHEHQAKRVNMGRGITVLGNQFPSSVADCLSKSQQKGKKFGHILIDGALERFCTWEAASDAGYCEIDWRDLNDIPETAMFIRVSGEAVSEEASEVITSIAKLRSKSLAYVITNAVTIEGISGMETLAENIGDEVKAFDVLAALLEQLSPEEQETIKGVLAS